MNQRLKSALSCAVGLSLIACLILIGQFGSAAPDFSQRNLAPSFSLPFGTDHLGRDLFIRSLQGLSVSFWLGLFASLLSVSIAIAMVLLAGLGKGFDRVISFLVDMMLSIPHFMLLILLAFVFGAGFMAVAFAIALSHWPRLALILRAEMLQLAAMPYIEASRAFGRGRLFILYNHILPHLLPQAMIGFLLMFPHAILHEAGLTFLGFGLEPSEPAIGVILAEAMRHLASGRWWLGLCPGVMLLGLVLLLDAIGQGLRRLTSLQEGQC